MIKELDRKGSQHGGQQEWNITELKRHIIRYGMTYVYRKATVGLRASKAFPLFLLCGLQADCGLY